MADVHDKHTRSFNMSRIKGKNTKPEMFVRLMPAASHVYRNDNVHRKSDSDRSRTFLSHQLFL